MKEHFKYIPQNKRKKILLICDDIRVHSGIATVTKEIVVHTAQHFNWIQMAGAINHPEKGKVFTLDQEINNLTGLKDASCKLYPVDGYGSPDILRATIRSEKPDAIMLVTDPRYFTWVFNMESEIRKNIPITYLNIWDDYPAPMYNRAFYEACDLLMGISKQTVNINKLVLKDCNKPRLFEYVPHGLNSNIYKPLPEDNPELLKMYNETFPNGTDFVLYFNSRNIRRKQIPDSLLAFRAFLDSLPIEKAKRCYFVLHTELSHEAGTNLLKVKEYLFDEKYPDQIKFSLTKMTQEQLNCLYNIADAQILLTSNEGWGLTITEAMLAGTPIIANVTGGMQDQMRFVDDKGEWFTPDDKIPSNHRGTFKEHGEWAFPVYPSSRSVQGSPPTPYIFDDRCRWEDAVEQIKKLYKLGRKKRKELGLKGREWALSDEAGFTSKHQAERVINIFDELFDTWKPKEKYEIINATEYKGRLLNHELIY